MGPGRRHLSLTRNQANPFAAPDYSKRLAAFNWFFCKLAGVVHSHQIRHPIKASQRDKLSGPQDRRLPAEEAVGLIGLLRLVEVEPFAPSRLEISSGNWGREAVRESSCRHCAHVREYSRYQERQPPVRPLDVGRSGALPLPGASWQKTTFIPSTVARMPSPT